jgi:peptidoglycan/xylan/chitin deacetylase (PgdA/CDA1 family)
MQADQHARHRHRVGGALTLAAAALALVQAAPLLTRAQRLRPLWPALSGVGTPGHVALTFDDGPDAASTPAFLALLGRRQVRATFFVLGEMVHRFPDVLRQVHDAGHEVAVHGWDHRSHLLHRPGRATTEQLERTVELIERTVGARPTFFRPPYGLLTTAGLLAASSCGLRPVLWTAWGEDWTATATAESVLRSVTSGAVDGGTVLLHDSDCTSAPRSWHATHRALPTLLDWCADRELTVGTLGEHGLPR